MKIEDVETIRFLTEKHDIFEQAQQDCQDRITSCVILEQQLWLKRTALRVIVKALNNEIVKLKKKK